MAERPTGIAHYVDGDCGVGVEVTAICGETFPVKGPDPDKPLCAKCAAITLDEYRTSAAQAEDMAHRLADIATALTLRDDLGQENWLHTEAEGAIFAAFYRPGPARPEGPATEDGREPR